MAMVKMVHRDSPDSGYSVVPQRSFDDYWSKKGWVIVGEKPAEEEASAESEPGTEPDTNTQED